MIGCSFVANRDYFGELGLLDSGMDVYGGENIELGIRVCVSPSFLLFLLPLYPCRFKWSNGHSSVAPLINEAPLRVLEGQSCVCSSQQGCGNKQVTHSEKVGEFFAVYLEILESQLLFCRVFVFGFVFAERQRKEYGTFSNYLSLSTFDKNSVHFFFLAKFICKVRLSTSFHQLFD